MTRTLTITADEWASRQDGTLWLVREGEPCATPRSCPKFTRQMCRWNGNHPPAEFVLACAPCETCHSRRSVRRYSAPVGGGYGVADCSEIPCPDCRIELVGPCPECEGGRYRHAKRIDLTYTQAMREGRLTEFLMGQAFDVKILPCPTPTVTHGYGYAVGEPQQILVYPDCGLGEDDPHICWAADDGVIMSLPDGDVLLWAADDETKASGPLARYGDGRALVGKWVLRVQAVA